MAVQRDPVYNATFILHFTNNDTQMIDGVTTTVYLWVSVKRTDQRFGRRREHPKARFYSVARK